MNGLTELTSDPNDFPGGTLSDWAFFIDPFNNQAVYVEHRLISAMMDIGGDPAPPERDEDDDPRMYVAKVMAFPKYNDYFHAIGTKITTFLAVKQHLPVDGTAVMFNFAGTDLNMFLGSYKGRYFVHLPNERTKHVVDFQAN